MNNVCKLYEHINDKYCKLYEHINDKYYYNTTINI